MLVANVWSKPPHGDLLAEVVGFAQDITYLMPEESLRGVMPGARVLPISSKAKVPLSMDLLGRVINGVGKPLDGKGTYSNLMMTIITTVNPLILYHDAPLLKYWM